ncbi:SBBP repeat-containing protein, partial [Stella sp.]|uniref:SBBP repeat-containing protein n=1 Tax=Stella sp. TaxID=2912054 RepID=UPI0035B2ECA8
MRNAGSSSANEQGEGIAVDGSGNSYVAGSFNGTVDFDGAGGAPPLVSVDQDVFVAKYDTEGTLLWVRNPGSSSSHEYGLGIAVDGSGNSYVTGDFYGTVDFDGVGSAPPLVAVNNDYFVAKYDPDGNLIWVRNPGSSASGETGQGIALDGSGNSYVTGYFSGTVDFDGAGSVPPLVAAYTDHFVAKYDSDGNLLWVRNSGSSNSDELGRGIAVDGSGKSYVTGYFSGTVDFDPGPGTALLETVTGYLKHFLLSYTPTGELGDADTAPPAVSAPDLDALSDSGASGTDNVTNADPLTFTGTGEAGAAVELFAD